MIYGAAFAAGLDRGGSYRAHVARMAERTTALGELEAPGANLPFRSFPIGPNAPHAETPDRPSARCVPAERLMRLVRQQSTGSTRQGGALSEGSDCGDLDNHGVYRSGRGRDRQCQLGGGRAACFGGWQGCPQTPETAERTITPPVIGDRELSANRKVPTITARSVLALEPSARVTALASMEPGFGIRSRRRYGF
jgi:hypothetical protein